MFRFRRLKPSDCSARSASEHREGVEQRIEHRQFPSFHFDLTRGSAQNAYVVQIYRHTAAFIALAYGDCDLSHERRLALRTRRVFMREYLPGKVCTVNNLDARSFCPDPMPTWWRRRLASAFVVGLALCLSGHSYAESAEIDQAITISKIFAAVAPDQRTWTTCLSFTNVSGSPVHAIQFKFTYYDAFDAAVASFNADRVGDFQPNVLVEGPKNVSDFVAPGTARKSENCWQVPIAAGSVFRITAEINKIRFSDGSVVDAPSPHAVFRGQYLNLDHPAKINCRIFGATMPMAYDTVAANPDGKCWKDYIKSIQPASPAPMPTSSQK